MSGSSSIMFAANLLHNNSSGLQVSQLQSKIAEGGECQQLDKEELYVKLSTFWYCFLAFITTLGLLVSLVSNTIIIYLFTKTRSLRRNPSNIIAVNLSLSDLLYCIQWPSVIYCSLTQSTWILEIDLLCQTFGFLTLSTAWASILTVLAMSIERAIVIGYSLHAKRRFTVRAAWLIVVLIWIISIASSLPPLFGKFNRYTLDPSKTSCTLDYLSSNPNYKLYILALYIAYWIAPAVLITICYVAIIVTFKRSSRSLRLISEHPLATSTLEFKGRFDNELPAISGPVSQPVTRQSSPLGWDFRCQSRAHFQFKLAQPRLRDPIRLRNLAGSLTLRRRTRNGGRNSTRPSTMGFEPAPRGNQLERRTACSSCTQVPGAAQGETPIGAACAAEEKVNLAQATGAKVTLASPCQDSHDRMQIVAEQAERLPLSCQDVTSRDHLIAASSCSTSQTRPRVGDGDLEAADRNKQLAGARRRRFNSRGLANLAALVARPNPDEPLDEADTFEDTFVQLTAVPQAGSSGGLVGGQRVGIRRSRTSQDLRASKAGAARMSDATSAANFHLSPNNANLARRSHKFAATISSFKAARCQVYPRPGRKRHTPMRGSSSSRHSGPSRAHFSRTGLQIRLAKMAFYLILLWFVSWTPIASLAMIHSVFKCQHRTSALAIFTANTMSKLGPAFDVFIYGISHPVIKKKFKKIFKRLFMIGRGNEQGSTSNRRAFERSKQISLRSNIT